METDLFGLADDEKEILAAVLYYAFDGTLQEASPVYHALTPRQKVITAKLTAIFRLADSLDKSHLGKISAIRAELKDDRLLYGRSRYFPGTLDISENGRRLCRSLWYFDGISERIG